MRLEGVSGERRIRSNRPEQLRPAREVRSSLFSHNDADGLWELDVTDAAV
jgi:hypothetical protein